MASWLDILSQNYSDSRGRLNPFALARGFTKDGRQEIDQNKEIATQGRNLTQRQGQNQLGALDFMAGSPDAMNTAPTTPEQAQVLQHLVTLAQGRAGVQQTQQATQQAGELFPLQKEGLQAGVESTRAGTAATQFNTQRGQQLLPVELRGMNLGNDATTAGIEQTRANTAATTQATQQGSELFPIQVAGAQMQNLNSAQQFNQNDQRFPEQMRGITLGNDLSQQSLSEAQDTAGLRKRVLEQGLDRVAPSVMAYLNTLPYTIGYPGADANVRGLLDLPREQTPPDTQGQALRDAIKAVTEKQQPQPVRTVTPPSTPPSTNQPSAPATGNRQFSPGLTGAGPGASEGIRNTLRASGEGLRKFMHDTSNAEPTHIQELQQILSDPTRKAQLQAMWPTLDERTKQYLLHLYQAGAKQ